MIDINEAPNKTAMALERFLEDCGNKDPYIQNIWMAARYLVAAGQGHYEYQTQYSSGTTHWKPQVSCHPVARIPYQPRTARMVINIWKGLVDSVISNYSMPVEILVVDQDGERTEYYEREIQVDPQTVAETVVAQQKYRNEKGTNDNKQ